MSKESEKSSGDLFVHYPLPYLVRVRIVTDEDRPPEQRTIAVLAYSVFEAMMQANLEAGGSGENNERVQVEHLAPDLLEYQRMLASAQVST